MYDLKIFSFEIILDLCRSNNNSTEFPYTFHLASPSDNIWQLKKHLFVLGSRVGSYIVIDMHFKFFKTFYFASLFFPLLFVEWAELMSKITNSPYVFCLYFHLTF